MTCQHEELTADSGQTGYMQCLKCGRSIPTEKVVVRILDDLTAIYEHLDLLLSTRHTSASTVARTPTPPAYTTPAEQFISGEAEDGADATGKRHV